jgi:hypothetical protein
MVAEAVVAGLVGIAALFLVLQPLLRPSGRPPRPPEPLDPEETPRGVALAALKEIDFDRETGKLSEGDYQFLKAKYTALAVEALRAEREDGIPQPVEAIVAARVRALRDGGMEPRPRCTVCGPRPEPDAVFCSTCGVQLSPVVLNSSLRVTGASHAPAPVQ